MNDYTKAAIYILLGILGAILHWAKKRYLDLTTETTLEEYVLGCPRQTINALWAIALSEMSLSFMQANDVISLQELLGAITAGYTFDSGLNKAQDKEK